MTDPEISAIMANINGQPAAPERIYGWIDSQLSVARYYGGCTYNGASYLIDMLDPDKPLVREDIYLAQLKAAKAADTAKRKAEMLKRLEAAKAQKGLL